MANLKIHLDGPENLLFKSTKDYKENNIYGGKRFVLGQLQNTVVTTHSVKAKEIFHSCITERIKALEIKDRESRKPNAIKNIIRSPLKDVYKKNNEKAKDYNLQSHMPVHFTPIPVYKDVKTNDSKEEDLQKLEFSTTAQTLLTKTVQLFSHFDYKFGYKSYQNDIYKYLRKLEEKFKPKAYYMRRQPEVSYSMRTILVDWLVEVSEEFKLHSETLFRAVLYVDRFLSSMAVARTKLQLLGISALFISAKFEEIHPPEVLELTYITDDSYTAKQILQMERLILRVLCFDLSSPTLYSFLLHISSKAKLLSNIFYLAMYICELSLLEADPYLDFHPSLITCGAIAIAKKCLCCTEIWPTSLVKITGYTLPELKPVIEHLNETHQKSFTLSQATIRHKYQTAEYEHVSQIPFKRLVLRE